MKDCDKDHDGEIDYREFLESIGFSKKEGASSVRSPVHSSVHSPIHSSVHSHSHVQSPYQSPFR
jgi:hypothetical protein